MARSENQRGDSSPITDNEKDTKYKLDLTISAIIVLSVSKLIPLPVK